MANYYCEYCVKRFSSVASLTSVYCFRHPDGLNKGKHKLHEDTEKNTLLISRKQIRFFILNLYY
jgi:hypothetical protein